MGTVKLAKFDPLGVQIAYEQAATSYEQNGIPIGSCIINNETGEVLGKGHNLRIQNSSPVFHGEMSALEDAGRLPGSVYRNCTIYTTLSPCSMCSGAILLYKFKRVVVCDTKNFQGSEDLLRANGIEVLNIEDEKCIKLMSRFIEERPEDWNEDIGE